MEKAYILVATVQVYDKDDKLRQFETLHLANYHFYKTLEEAKRARQKFISTLLMNGPHVEPQYFTDYDLNPTDILKGYIIHYADGGWHDEEIEIEELTLED